MASLLRNKTEDEKLIYEIQSRVLTLALKWPKVKDKTQAKYNSLHWVKITIEDILKTQETESEKESSNDSDIRSDGK